MAEADLWSSIEALLLVARADASANVGDFENALQLYQDAWVRDSASIDCEQLLRLCFLTENWSEFSRRLPDVPEQRRAMWSAVLEVATTETLSSQWDGTAQKQFDAVYLAYLANAQGAVAEAQGAWKSYLGEVQESWEYHTVSRWRLAHQPANCGMCLDKAATHYQHGHPLCAGCHAWASDETAFLEALKAATPEQIRLLENLSGQPYEPYEPLGDFVDPFFRPKPQPDAPLAELKELEPLLDAMDKEARAFWDRAKELAQSAGEELAALHLWSALLEETECVEVLRIQEDELSKIREEVPTETDLVWLLNLARWDGALMPQRRNDNISPVNLLCACQWSLPPRADSKAESHAFLTANALVEPQLSEFERILERRPDEPYLRLVLSRHFKAAERDKEVERYLWFVRHYPEYSQHAHSPLAPRYQRAVTEAWAEKVLAHPNHVGVLTGAIHFFCYPHQLLRLRLRQRVAELEPEALHVIQVAWAYESLAENLKPGVERQNHLRAALQWIERAIAVLPQFERYTYLEEAMHAAQELPDWDKLESFATKVLSLASADAELERDYDVGVVRQAHLAMAQAALQREDRKTAISHLSTAVKDAEAIDYTYDPELVSKMEERSDPEAVRRHLDMATASEQWILRRLKRWLAMLKAGETPDLNDWGQND